MFKWDGTDVTDLVSNADIYESKYNKLAYWIIQYIHLETNKYYEEICIVKNCKNSIPALIDELKPIFGLKKLGTHWCKVKGKIRLLIRPIKTPEGVVKEDLKLSNIEDEHITPELTSQIQDIFAFRELLGVTCSYSSSIIVRTQDEKPVPISFYEPNMRTEDVKVIPFSVLDKWFVDSSIDKVVLRLCKIKNIGQIGKVLHNLRIKIEDVIERVDRRAITFKTCILNRITERLQTSL